MDFMEVIRSRRTIRFFKQDPIGVNVLFELVEAGRLAPSASNGQPVEYVIVNDKTRWSGFLSSWGGVHTFSRDAIPLPDVGLWRISWC